MNNVRRKELKQAIATIQYAQNIINNAMEDEEESYNNLTEGLQQTERGQRMEEVIDILSEASDTCDEIISTIEDAMY